MPKKAVTTNEPPQRRDSDRQIDQQFLELINPEGVPLPSLPLGKPARPRQRAPKTVDGVAIAAQPERRREKAPEDQNVTTFRGIPKTLSASIKRFALEIDFPIGIAARLLLELGVKEFQAGRLHLVPKVSFKGLSLYPTSGNPVGRPVDTRKKKPSATTPAAFRGIPAAVIQAIEAIQDDLAVPKGEIARRLFEHSLSLYSQGKLEIPDPVSWLKGEVVLITVRAPEVGQPGPDRI
jgi:hypothetical protein